MVMVCLLVENLDFLSATPTVGLTDEVYFFLAGLTVLTLVIYLISEHRRNKLTLDWVLAPILIVMLVCGIIAIWSNPDSIQFTDEAGHVIEVGFIQMDKIRYTVNACVGSLAIYVLSFVFSRTKIKSRKLMWAPLIGVIVCTILGICSFFIDTSFYEALKGGYISNSTGGAKSVFMNENAFGYYMFIGLIMCFIVIYQKPKWVWMWLFAIALSLFIVFSTCTTCILLACVLFIAFTTLQLIFGYVHKHFATSIIGSIIFISLLILILLLIFVGNEKLWKPMVAVANFIRKEIFDKDFTTFSNRKEVWETTLKMVNANPFRICLGYGYGIANKIFSAYYATVNQYAELKSVHSGYLTVLVSGGWIRLGLYILLLVYFVYCVIRLIIKKQVNFALTYFLLFISLLGHDFFEQSHFFEFNVNGLLLTGVVLMPPMIAWKNYRHPNHRERIMAAYAMPTQGVPAKSFVSMLSLVIISVAIPLACSLLVPCMHTNELALKIALAVLIFLGASIVFAPYLIFLWYKKATDRRFIFRIFLNSILIFGGTGAAVYLYITKLSLGLATSVLLGIATYAGCLLLDMVIYSLFRKGKFLQWLKETFFSIFVNNIVGIVAGTIITLLIFLIVPAFVTLNLKTLLIVGIAAVELFWVTYLLIPSKNKNRMLDDFNEEGLLNLKRLILEDRR